MARPLVRPPRPLQFTLNLAPMVDVMMCLIIFFLLASRLVSTQQRPLSLAYAKAAREVDRGQLGARVVVNVRAAGETDAEYVVNNWDGRTVGERVIAPDELPSFLQDAAARLRANAEDVRCVIRADRNVAYGHVEVALRAAGVAKIGKIIFSANAGAEPEATP